MPNEDHVEREATDQPPPIHDPLTRAQIISLVVPAVSFLALIGLLAWGLLTTGGTPPDRVAKLHAALAEVLAESELRRKLVEGGVEVEPSDSPEAFARYFAEDRARWTPVVQRAGMRVD